MRIAIALVVAVTLLSAGASAQERPLFWFGGSAGYGTYTMDDINDTIRDVNQAYDLNMDEVKSGFAFGVQTGVQLSPPVTIFAGYERLTAGTDFGGPGYSFEYSLPANAFFAGAQYTFPYAPTFRFGFAGALGLISVDGQLELSVAGGGTESCSVSGSSVFFQGQAVADYRPAERVILSPSVGYRVAKIGEFEECGETAYMLDGSKATLDYSGLLLRGAVKLILN